MTGKIMIALLLLTTLPILAMSPGGSDEKRAEDQKRYTQRMSQALNLREDQIAKFEEIMQVQKEAQKELYQKIMEQRKTLQDETIQKLSVILDENQLGRYEAFIQGMRMAKQYKSSKDRIQRKKPD